MCRGEVGGEAPVETDLQRNIVRGACADCAIGVLERQCHRLFAEDMLACLRCCYHEIGVS